MDENRFSDRYAQQQVDWYSLKEYKKNGVQVYSQLLQGRADEYFNKRFWRGKFEVPILTIDGLIWMSITPCEIQSMILPIYRAWGSVGTGGLGMGYFALKCAEKDNVDEIKVWEDNPHIIEFFNESFSHRKGFEKIKVIEGDARKIKNQQFSFFFMDIYGTQMSDRIMEDADNFWRNNNDAGSYHFWCQEWPLLQSYVNGNRPFLEADEQILLGEFFECDYLHLDVNGDMQKKFNFYRSLDDPKLVNEIVQDYLGR